MTKSVIKKTPNKQKSNLKDRKSLEPQQKKLLINNNNYTTKNNFMKYFEDIASQTKN